MTIHLKADQEDRIAEAVRSDAYRGPDEVIDRALEVLQAHNQWLTADRQTMQLNPERQRGADPTPRASAKGQLNPER